MAKGPESELADIGKELFTLNCGAPGAAEKLAELTERVDQIFETWLEPEQPLGAPRSRDTGT